MCYSPFIRGKGVEGLEQDFKKNIMKQFFTNTWKWLDGNKTIICSIAYGALQEGIRSGVLHDSAYMRWGLGITLVLGGGSLADHIKKGYFTTKKGS